MLTDSHAHLVSLEDAAGAIERARNEGVGRIVSIASDLESAMKTIEIAGTVDMVYATVGVHPHSADRASEDVLNEFRKLASHPKVVAVGETGLDYFYMNSDKETQIESFRDQLRLAFDTNLPVIIHVRDADRDLFDILNDEKLPEKPGVIHCFTGNYETARRYLDLGFYISFSGIATFKKSEEIREAAGKIPGDRILIETDSPYLAPVPYRGKPNEPAYVKHTAEVIAGVRGTSFEEIARITSENAAELFGLQKVTNTS